ncbi:LacI family transcriptional regulator [Anaerocolumna cellulosilytica]|uniref:LacI family transcriptional regulator n=1 Tax=Anaerocolumna cellulosilytica TaxID=433286 RepID=A0A6S6R0M8_9FIRM|nr:LacI family DNA-binding transcriptional regulator [Anaerocolumna cellulosilytica]MBB5193906.1 DNA-binding LacI/PurR family transcriptional regulator [Anaerocolumna cellulosilytica]BCJ94879.1 LacI family transcriptional regulator [Anaerocolumna cellulosilytica]
MPITISDVAREAGVSTSTVSKVLNNWTTISPATVDRVKHAIHKLNYTPNSRAVSFARQTTQNIVFLTSLGKNEAYHNPHMFDIMCGVNSILAKNNYTLSLVDIFNDSYQGESVTRVMAQKCADGMVIHGSAISKEIADLITKQQFPHILIGHPGFETQLCWIDTNHVLAGQAAAEYLISNNYGDVAFIGGKKTDHISMQRLKGFLGTMHSYGYLVSPEKILYTNSSREESYEATIRLLELKKSPSAIVCESNTIALGTARAIEKMKLEVPKDIAFLTFDAYPYSEIIDPKPTVIDINVYDMGIQAGIMLLRKMENPALQIQTYTTLPVVNAGKTT